MITISIVSHGHQSMVNRLLADLSAFPEITSIILTLNLLEDEPVFIGTMREMTRIIKNETPKGFASNHNAAFAHCKTLYFCVLNPDVRMPENPFNKLLELLKEQQTILASPAIVNSEGNLEDSVRTFPTPLGVLKKLLSHNRGTYPFAKGDKPFYPHWVGGMFMLFETKAFADLNGFDENFFLYYEDVDICARIWKTGSKLVVCPEVTVIHDAQRDSHRKMKYLRWHLTSMLRFFIKHLGRLPDPNKNSGVI